MAYPGSPFAKACLKGHVALITGGTSGIGLEISRCLGIHGCKVVVTGRRQSVLDEAVQMLRDNDIDALGLQGDVRNISDCEDWVKRTLEACSMLSILVNCAAGNFLATAEELSSNGFRSVMEIDALGTFNMSRAAYPALAAATGLPCVINISATLHYGATWYQVHSAAAKAAVDSMTRTMALEWGAAGIRVNAVAPGPIQGTAGMSKLAPGSEDKAAENVKAVIPLGRMGQRADIGLACVYLSSTAASFVSGHVMVVDGAAWLWRTPVVDRSAVSKVSRSVESNSRKVGTGSQSKL
eukprot:jgi/Ulvmu1/4527/UM002_0253.1